jgi:hypothetical protein
VIATMSTVWDRTAEFLSDNLAALAPVVLLGLFVPLTLMGALMPLIKSNGTAGDLTIAVIVVLLSLGTVWARLAITALAFAPAAGRTPAIQTANRRFVPVVGIALTTLVVTVAATFPIFIALALSGADMDALAAGRMSGDTLDGGALAFVTLYGLVFCLVAFWAYARFLVLVVPIMIMERRGLGVYARSLVLTRGIAWKVIGMILLYGIVSWVAATAAKTVFGSIFMLLIGGEGTLSLAGVLTQVVVAGISTIFTVIAVAFIAKLYLATRDAREAIVEAS